MSDHRIRKVLHGCHNDIIWLQRDFRVYVVNVFDTEKACQVRPSHRTSMLDVTYAYRLGIKEAKE